jgi:hypothetical protein
MMKGDVLYRTAAALISTCVASETLAQAPAAPNGGPAVPPWVDRGPDWEAQKARLRDFGVQFDTSMALYEHLKAAANGGTRLDWQQMKEPAYDWSGVWTRTAGGLSFDPDLKAADGATSAKLTLEGKAKVDTKIKQLKETGLTEAGASWNEPHPTQGCSPTKLQATGGDGPFYCFAAD